MAKKIAMSTMGYAIVLFIIIGIVMIVSTPMLLDKVKSDKAGDKKYSTPVENNEYRSSSTDNSEVMSELRSIESSLSSRISSLERRQADYTGTISDKFVCSVEGTVSPDGEITPLSGQGSIDVRTSKIVFICEYRQ